MQISPKKSEGLRICSTVEEFGFRSLREKWNIQLPSSTVASGLKLDALLSMQPQIFSLLSIPVQST